MLLACRMRVGDPTCGAVYSMDSITAAVIGGTSMAGGVGLLSGTVAGAFLIGMLSNIMNNLAVNQFVQYVLKGSLLIVAMVIYSISNLLEVKRRER
jgi:ribose/xylose/arabinose/galactoside ABC-type transport system permease subunit